MPLVALPPSASPSQHQQGAGYQQGPKQQDHHHHHQQQQQQPLLEDYELAFASLLGLQLLPGLRQAWGAAPFLDLLLSDNEAVRWAAVQALGLQLQLVRAHAGALFVAACAARVLGLRRQAAVCRC